MSKPIRNAGQWVKNPETNRLIAKAGPKYRQLIKLGVIKEDEDYKQPKLVLEKKVKAVANINALTRNEVDDLYEQLKVLREKNENVLQRRGRKQGATGNPEKPKVKEDLKPKKKPLFNVKVKPPANQTETEVDITELDL